MQRSTVKESERRHVIVDQGALLSRPMNDDFRKGDVRRRHGLPSHRPWHSPSWRREGSAFASCQTSGAGSSTAQRQPRQPGERPCTGRSSCPVRRCLDRADNIPLIASASEEARALLLLAAVASHPAFWILALGCQILSRGGLIDPFAQAGPAPAIGRGPRRWFLDGATPCGVRARIRLAIFQGRFPRATMQAVSPSSGICGGTQDRDDRWK